MKEHLVSPAVIREIVANAPVGANRAEELMDLYNFPENVKGIKTLDIGASQSNLCAHLLDLGANAYAVDPLYANLSDLDIPLLHINAVGY